MTPQEELYYALKTDSAILLVVDDDISKISNKYPIISMFGTNTASNFPRITYILDERTHALFVDNKPIYDELYFNVDIWLPSTSLVDFSLNAIKLEIDRIVLTLGYAKVGESEKREIEERVSHLSLTYKKEFPSNL